MRASLVSGGVDALELLEGVSETHQARCMPHPAQLPESERTVIEASARAEAHAAAVEADQGQKHHIEPARTEGAATLRLGDAEAVVFPGPLLGYEAHGARCAPPIDTGEKHPAAPAFGECDQGARVELPGERGVRGDAPVVSQLQEAVGVARHEPSDVRTLLSGHLATACIEARPQCPAGGTQ